MVFDMLRILHDAKVKMSLLEVVENKADELGA